MNGGSVLIDKFESRLSGTQKLVCTGSMLYQYSLAYWIAITDLHTDTIYRPHFAVSSLMLRRFTSHDNGTTLSATIVICDSV